jgi:putative SOS response-associated peptidase YedK
MEQGHEDRTPHHNARAENVAEKPAFRDAEPMVFTELWEQWLGQGGERLDSCTIIVCEASKQLKPLH